jgi:CrcB protein
MAVKFMIFVGAGGFVGAGIRYLVTLAMNRLFPEFPFGTLFSNVLAGFLIGLVVGIERNGMSFDGNVRLFLVPGLLGGLSTFSAFSMEMVAMVERSRYVAAGVNALLNLGFSLLFAVLGIFAAKTLKS